MEVPLRARQLHPGQTCSPPKWSRSVSQRKNQEAIFFNSWIGRTMFSAGRFSSVGLVMATLIDFRRGSAHKIVVMAMNTVTAPTFQLLFLLAACWAPWPLEQGQ